MVSDAQAQSPRAGDATITVGGDLSGQVAIGDNIIQLRIDTLHGNVIQQLAPEAAPTVRRRPPLRQRPPPPARFVDRREQIRELAEVAAARLPVSVSGPRGVGKSALLRQLAHDPALEGVGGVAHLPAARLTAADLEQAVFDLFYDTDGAYKPSRGELTHCLRGLDAVLLIDDVQLDADEAAGLADLMTGSAVVMASTVELLDRSLRLGGLEGSDAIAVVEATLGRALSDDERVHTEHLVQATAGEPLALLQAVGATDWSVPRPKQQPVAWTLAGLDVRERRLVQLLASVPGIALDIGQLSALDEADRLTHVLDGLERAGLVHTHPSAGIPVRYALAGSVGEEVAALWDLGAVRERVYAQAATWARRLRPGKSVPVGVVDGLRAVARDARVRERWEVAQEILRGVEPALVVRGLWDAWLDVLDELGRIATERGDQATRAYVLHQQGTRAVCLGQLGVGAQLLRQALELRRELGDQAGEAATRQNLEVTAGADTGNGQSHEGNGGHGWRPTHWVTGLVITAIAAATLGLGVVLDLFPSAVTVRVPDVVGLDRDAAVSRLADAGLAAVFAPDTTTTQGAPEVVVAQEPPAATEVEERTSVSLRLGGDPTVVTVPSVVGSPAADAEAMIIDAGLEARRQETVTSAADPGIVVAQDPPAGSEAGQGATVTVTVARGTAVPDVEGRSLTEATEALREVGLALVEDLVRSPAASGTVVATVVAQDPAPGTEVRPGSSVTVEIAGVQVANVVGVDLERARRTFESLGLPTTTTPQEAVTRVRTVIRQDPSAGALVAPGSPVELTFAVVRIPEDLVGLHVDEAAARLEDLGLTVDRRPVPGDQDGIVIQVGRAGEVVEEPITVELVYEAVPVVE